MSLFLIIFVPIALAVIGVAVYVDRRGRRAWTTEARERIAARHRHPSGKRRPRGEDVWAAADAEVWASTREARTAELRALPPVPTSLARLN